MKFYIHLGKYKDMITHSVHRIKKQGGNPQTSTTVSKIEKMREISRKNLNLICRTLEEELGMLNFTKFYSYNRSMALKKIKR